MKKLLGLNDGLNSKPVLFSSGLTYKLLYPDQYN